VISGVFDLKKLKFSNPKSCTKASTAFDDAGKERQKEFNDTACRLIFQLFSSLRLVQTEQEEHQKEGGRSEGGRPSPEHHKSH
jgi:hypothetical protein